MFIFAWRKLRWGQNLSCHDEHRSRRPEVAHPDLKPDIQGLKLPHNPNLTLIVYSAGPPSTWRLTIEPCSNKSSWRLLTPSSNFSCSWNTELVTSPEHDLYRLPGRIANEAVCHQILKLQKTRHSIALWPGRSYPRHVLPVIHLPWSHPLLVLFLNGQDVHRFSKMYDHTSLRQNGHSAKCTQCPECTQFPACTQCPACTRCPQWPTNPRDLVII